MDPSLYIHIPFCRKKCGYCDFFSLAEQDPSIQEFSLSRILEELGNLVSISAPSRFPTVFIGGGTPSSVPLPLLEPFLLELSGRIFDLPVKPGAQTEKFEWTIECNPESLSPSHIELFRAAGITRISLGVQSLEDKVLRASGRLGSARESKEALGLLAREWTGEGKSFGVDFIAGLPGESGESLEQGIETALQSGASHISLYNLTIEDGTAFAARHGSEPRFLPSEDEKDELWFAGRELLENSGLLQYEVANFAVPGKECLHNLGYWDLEPYFGLGPSAVSCFPLEGGIAERITRPRSLELWLRGEFEEEKIGYDDFLFENLLMAFRTKRGLSRRIFRGRFGCGPEECIGRTLEKWKGGGRIGDSGERIALDGKGILLLNRFLLDCMKELDGGRR